VARPGLTTSGEEPRKWSDAACAAKEPIRPLIPACEHEEERVRVVPAKAGTHCADVSILLSAVIPVGRAMDLGFRRENPQSLLRFLHRLVRGNEWRRGLRSIATGSPTGALPHLILRESF
jgi:hypothetical protein